jgi:tripartite-type tricarboxylate transporter receptor subunit TctC
MEEQSDANLTRRGGDSMKHMACTACALLLTTAPAAGVAQQWPARPLRIITAEVGGSLDFASRIIAQGLTQALGQQVIVENRGGAGGAIGIEMTAKATPDGYTLLLYGSAIWLLPALRPSVGWDPVKDFAPVTMAATSPHIVLVHPSVAAKSVQELIALAKSKPGGLNYASGGPGSTAHIVTEIFKSVAGVEMVHVPYKGGGPGLNDLVAGKVQVMLPPISANVVSQVKAGRLRALAVTSAQPSGLMPELPTAAAAGLPGYEAASIVGVFAPAKVPTRILARLNAETVGVLRRPEVRERFLNAGVDVLATDVAESSAINRREWEKLRKVVREAGIRSD